jgi:hypothetical protein
VQEKAGVKLSISLSDLDQVDLAFREEFHNNVLNKLDYTRLALKDNSGKTYILELEKGESFKGVFQMLHYIVGSE